MAKFLKSISLLSDKEIDILKESKTYDNGFTLKSAGLVKLLMGFYTPFELDRKLRFSKLHNYSDREMDVLTHTLLSKGAKFIPTPKMADIHEITDDFFMFMRRIYLIDYFYNETSKLPSVPKKLIIRSNWDPPEPPEIERYQEETWHRLVMAFPQLKYKGLFRRFTNNLSRDLRQKVFDLRNQKELVFRLADKNMGWTILHSDKYIELMQNFLFNPLFFDPISEEDALNVYLQPCNKAKTLLTEIKKFEFEEDCTIACIKYLTNTSEWSIPHIYGLPKVHKIPLEIRPIVACHSWFTTPISVYLDAVVRKYVSTRSIPTYLKDTITLLQIIEKTPMPITFSTNDLWLVSGDISALYPNIPIEDGLSALTEFLFNYTPLDHRIINRLTELTEIVLRNNIVCFDKFYYKQTHGTAMGTPFAVLFSIIFVHSLECRLTKPPGVILWKRYIDDILIVYKGPFEDLQKFLDDYNNLADTIHVNWKWSNSRIDFLDLTIKIDQRINRTIPLLDVKLFRKPGNAYQYLPFDSAHPPHCKKAFPTAELIRICRNCSLEKEFLEERTKFFFLLRDRGYPPSFISKCFENVKFSLRQEYIFKEKSRKIDRDSKRLVFVTRYNPLLKSLPLRRLLLDHVYLLPEYLQKEFESLIISYSKSSSLSNLLSPSKFES